MTAVFILSKLAESAPSGAGADQTLLRVLGGFIEQRLGLGGVRLLTRLGASKCMCSTPSARKSVGSILQHLRAVAKAFAYCRLHVGVHQNFQHLFLDNAVRILLQKTFNRRGLACGVGWPIAAL